MYASALFRCKRHTISACQPIPQLGSSHFDRRLRFSWCAAATFISGLLRVSFSVCYIFWQSSRSGDNNILDVTKWQQSHAFSRRQLLLARWIAPLRFGVTCERQVWTLFRIKLISWVPFGVAYLWLSLLVLYTYE